MALLPSTFDPANQPGGRKSFGWEDGLHIVQLTEGVLQLLAQLVALCGDRIHVVLGQRQLVVERLDLRLQLVLAGGGLPWRKAKAKADRAVAHASTGSSGPASLLPRPKRT